MKEKKPERIKPERKPEVRQAPPFVSGIAVMHIGGCLPGDRVELTEMSENGAVLFGKFLTGPKAGSEFSCPIRAIKKA